MGSGLTPGCGLYRSTRCETGLANADAGRTVGSNVTGTTVARKTASGCTEVAIAVDMTGVSVTYTAVGTMLVAVVPVAEAVGVSDGISVTDGVGLR